MRLLILLLGFCVALSVKAQNNPSAILKIQISYDTPGHYLEQAINLIEATNIIGKSVSAEYTAGRSVVLSPGFETKVGSVFSAEIKPLDITEGAGLQLKAFPNPFELSTMIDYSLPADGKVNLWVSDAKGNIIGRLIQEEMQKAGKHQIEWKAESISSGVYMPVLEVDQKKVVYRLIKK